MSLDPSKLEKVHERDGKTIARCPACAEVGADRKGDHLSIDSQGRFACVTNPGPEGKAHRIRIFELVGIPDAPVNGNGHAPRKRIVATYPYTDQNGKLLFEVCRFEPKDFRQRRPDPSGKDGWIWNVKGVRRVPYRLPELLLAVRDGRPVFIPEGEKDVLDLVKAGFAATTNPGGAGKWLPDFGKYLRGAEVIIVADKDDAGRDHAQVVAMTLHGTAGSVRVIEVPDVNGKGCKDAADFFAAGGDPVELDDLAERAPVWTLGTSALSQSDRRPSDPVDPITALDAYYETNRRLYLTRNAGGRWLPFAEGQFKKRLRAEGIRAKAYEGENLAPADQVLLFLQDHRDMGYAAPLAGRAAGFYAENGARYLVTDSPHFLTPEKGEWRMLRAFLENLLVNNEPEHGARQWHTFLTWLKGSVEALRAGMTKEAQALAIAGPPQSGKSLLQRLITHLLGGRECKPFLFMSGRTPFNAELFEAEHLALEDEHMSRKLADRLTLAAAIKGFVANETHSCHRKYCTPITLRPFWRLTITLNDEPEALLVLPPLDEHVADKILLLRASRFALPMPTTTKDERAGFWRCLMGELPAFLHCLLNEYQPPDGFTDARYVVVGWHHPVLAEALHELSPSAALLALIDQLAPWGALEDEWEGTAEELRTQLFQHSGTAADARRLLEWQQACGNYLATLAKKNPERVQPHRTNTACLWIIRKP